MNLLKNLLLAFFLLFFYNSSAVYSEDRKSMLSYEKEWKTIQEKDGQGKPQEGLKLVLELEKKAVQEKNTAQIIKALIYELKFRSLREEEGFEKSIERFGELLKTKVYGEFPVKQLIHSILAELYWKYFEANRYTFLERTQTTNKPNDIRTWDLQTLANSTLENYLLSLQELNKLESYSIEELSPILEENQTTRYLRPTLYDFLAHRAIDFLLNTQSGLPDPKDKFTLDYIINPNTNQKEFIYLQDAKTFFEYPLKTTQENSFLFHGIKVFQELLKRKWELKEKNPTQENISAFIDADLKRIQFVYNNSYVYEKESLYLLALENLYNQYSKNPFASQIKFLVARVFKDRAQKFNPKASSLYKWDYKTAYDICEDAIQKYPNTMGSRNCASLQSEIKRKELHFVVEKNQLPEPFFGKLEYRNVSKIFVKILEYDPKILQEAQKIYKDHNAKGNHRDFLTIFIDVLNSKKSIVNFEKNLPHEGDFQKYSVEIDFPNLKKLGKYIILISDSENFSYSSHAVLLEFIQVTNLSFIQRYSESANEFYVIHRKTGKPLQAVQVEAIEQIYDYQERIYKDNIFLKLKTDSNGFFSIPLKYDKNRNYYLLLKNNEEKLEISNIQFFEVYHTTPYKSIYSQNSYYKEQEETPQNKTFLFTDRAIYRPGQVLYFKGLSLKVQNLDSKILSNSEVTVELLDPNGQVIKQEHFITNDYGTFHGSFILPTSGLNGVFTLRTTNNYHSIHVEEYKRPKFEVSLESPKESFRLKEKIKLQGLAKTYSGAFVDGAFVQYRVFRKAIFPPWWSWWRKVSSSEQEIALGKSKTNEKGEFSFEFEAIPDEGISPESKPYFEYQITVDVTDTNGETQTATTIVSVGYTALNLSINLPSFLEKSTQKKYSVSLTNLSGIKEKGLVNVKVHKLKSPKREYKPRKWEAPIKQILTHSEWEKLFPDFAYQEEDKIQNWEKERQVFQVELNTSETTELLFTELDKWESGAYFLEAKTKDKFGEEVKAQYFFTLYGLNEKAIPYKAYDLWIGVKTHAEVDEEFLYLTNQVPKTMALYELEHKGKIVHSEWIEFSKEENFYSIQGKIEEKHRGNLGLHFTFIKDNRAFSHSEVISVPYSNKELKISYETFRNKLYPGSKEEWKLKLSGPKGEKIAAEMLATLYDASLDAFVTHSFSLPIYNFYYPRRTWNKDQSFSYKNATNYNENWNPYSYYESLVYEKLNWFRFYYYGYEYHPRMLKKSRAYRDERPEAGGMVMEDAPAPAPVAESAPMEKESISSAPTPKPSKPKESLQVRSNFQETAFFYPQLETDSEGNIIIKFQIPDSLTKWKFLSFAHTKDLMLGFSQNELVTQKDLMVTPNPPRFLREGDSIYFGTKIINLTNEIIKGQVSLNLFNALDGQEVSNLFGEPKKLDFEVNKNSSNYVEWKLKIPSNISAVNYRIVAHSENFSDGEEMSLPILTNRQLVTESLPISIRGGEKRIFELKKLTNLQDSKNTTLSHHRLTFEFTPNPAWYAVQALPYLMEYPYECVEQTFSRFYANSLSHHIVNSNPKIKKVFEAWQKIPSSEKGALSSNLEKNQELKNIILEQTPWVREAIDESERKKRISFLFDINKMTNELEQSLRKIIEQQLSEGGWGWFKGFPSDRYITQHIVSGMGQLSKLGVKNLLERSDIKGMLKKAISYLDKQIAEDLLELKKMEKEKLIKLKDDNLSYIQIHYLYARSFFLEIPIPKESKEALEYFQDQAKKYWLDKNIYSQGLLAISLHRWKEKETPKKIIESLKDKALHSDEFGMYWKFSYGFYWYELPIETQSLMIELFEEVANDKKAVDSLKTWLLKQKQTTDWKTTKATANAIYALLLRGEDWLNTSSDVQIQIGSFYLQPKSENNLTTPRNAKVISVDPEEGTGYFKKAFLPNEITPSMGKISIQKQKSGVSWGALYWQYFENLDKITTHQTPLQLKKELYILENTEKGQILVPITQRKPKVGDLLKVRIELRADRNMEYVHMKDMRATAFEPIDVFSSYKYQDGLYYYQSTRDASTDFFFSYLPKGTYVFEYSLRVTYKGDFSNGITTIQCMYAPEFTSHSEGIRVKILE